MKTPADLNDRRLKKMKYRMMGVSNCIVEATGSDLTDSEKDII
jgi:hypothetical protein